MGRWRRDVVNWGGGGEEEEEKNGESTERKKKWETLGLGVSGGLRCVEKGEEDDCRDTKTL